MRTFKFRAWDKSKKYWVTNWAIVPEMSLQKQSDPTSPSIKGNLVETERRREVFGHGSFGNVLHVKSYYDLPYALENVVIQQSTGLKDKNGKEIYEGDLLTQTCDNKPCDYLVEWGERGEYCGFVLHPRMKRDGTFTLTIHDFRSYLAECFEVIGNIFDNPELSPKTNE